MARITFGIVHFLQTQQDKTKRWGLVTNDAVFTRDFVPVRQALLNHGFQLVRLFSPEHGLQVIGADGALMAHQTDALTGLPVFSLYGDNLRPPAEVLEDLDGILFDLPDIGVRFYTYIWTLSYLMEACHVARVPLVVLDRPNPLSGNLALAEGPMLDETRAASFIGRWRMPIRHSLSIGELALFWQKERFSEALDLSVYQVQHWKREQFFQDLKLPFVPSSPAISSIETLLTYPALCFLEGLNVSEGRGTTFPFRVCGAPWMNGFVLARAFNDCGLDGVKARPFSFTPSEGSYKNQVCQGIMLHVLDAPVFRPVYVGLYLVGLLKKLYPEQLQWANYPTHVNKTGARHFDLLTGTTKVRETLEDDVDQFFSQIEELTRVSDWRERTEAFLLY
ncbi:exo-beta-N-acetylmuramidase NamZ domain-containing protein [Haliscomenobacter sp.]|uniref:exo-beta-N-acetylmuramidase NamZ family protein n=1 Tax=Haliscomenobacter sp. TaxID=2717303 RepID=UPI0035948397